MSIEAFVIRLTKYHKFDGRPVVDYPTGKGPVIVRHEMTDAQAKLQEVLELQWNAIHRMKTLPGPNGKLADVLSAAAEGHGGDDAISIEDGSFDCFEIGLPAENALLSGGPTFIAANPV